MEQDRVLKQLEEIRKEVKKKEEIHRALQERLQEAESKDKKGEGLTVTTEDATQRNESNVQCDKQDESIRPGNATEGTKLCTEGEHTTLEDDTIVGKLQPFNKLKTKKAIKTPSTKSRADSQTKGSTGRNNESIQERKQSCST